MLSISFPVALYDFPFAGYPSIIYFPKQSTTPQGCLLAKLHQCQASSAVAVNMCFSRGRYCRCLAIGAPDAEVKLGLLSDIAQEHSVEWDSHRAHQEMITGNGILHMQTHAEGSSRLCQTVD